MDVVWLVFWLILFFHWVDMFFTVLYLSWKEKLYKDAWRLEYNFHKHFFRLWGYWRGGFASFCWSCLFLSIYLDLTIWMGMVELLYAILGAMFVVAYINALHYFKGRKIKLEKRDEPKIIKIPVPVRPGIVENE